MYRYKSHPNLSLFETPGFKSLQMLSNGPFIFRQYTEVHIDDNVMVVQLKSNDEIASESSENGTDTLNMSGSDVDINDMEESELERREVSEYIGLTDLPPLLYTLTIEGCVDLVSLPEKLTCEHRYLRNLIIINCCYLESFHGGHPPTALEILCIQNCRKLEFISPARTKFKNSLLQYLCIQSSCDSLMFLPLDSFPKLEILTIWDCANLSFILTAKDHMSLQKLQIRDCPKLISFPKGGLRTPNLVSILLSNCKNLKVLPDQLYKLTSLLKLDIRECPELESIPEGGLPCNLYSLRIISCEKLTPRTEWGMRKLKDLVYFEIEGGCRDLESFPDQNLLPSSINQLRISRLQDLQFLDYRGLEQLKSLEILTSSIDGINDRRTYYFCSLDAGEVLDLEDPFLSHGYLKAGNEITFS
ncbi:hypothetical protein Q3G72_033122 [Acer saccharum]|nr:hypothetical protein Q3G72_033122 [Acer saccharum]